MGCVKYVSICIRVIDFHHHVVYNRFVIWKLVDAMSMLKVTQFKRLYIGSEIVLQKIEFYLSACSSWCFGACSVVFPLLLFLCFYITFQAKAIISLVLVNINFVSSKCQMVTDGYEDWIHSELCAHSVCVCWWWFCSSCRKWRWYFAQRKTLAHNLCHISSCYSPSFYLTLFSSDARCSAHTSPSYLII